MNASAYSDAPAGVAVIFSLEPWDESLPGAVIALLSTVLGREAVVLLLLGDVDGAEAEVEVGKAAVAEAVYNVDMMSHLG